MMNSPQSSTASWAWKSEPSSPSYSCENDLQLFGEEDPFSSVLINDLSDNATSGDVFKQEENVTNETKAQLASKLLDDLEHLEHLDQWIKEEPLPFSDWLEEKIDLPLFDIPPLVVSQPLQQFLTPLPPSPPLHGETIAMYGAPAAVPVIPTSRDTEALLQEFETVFDAVELTHATLTPPQSPNRTVTSETAGRSSATTTAPYADRPLPLPTYQSQTAAPYDIDMAAVDELVRSRAENLVWGEMSSSTLPPSPSFSSSSSSGEESIDDPEWLPQPTTPEPTLSSPSVAPKGRGRRPKPYDRSTTEDKRSRKKEQNKNAATRYRQKKKQEVEVILSEERGLMDKNDSLRTEVNDLSREIKYLKGLMRDLFRAKGLIP